MTEGQTDIAESWDPPDLKRVNISYSSQVTIVINPPILDSGEQLPSATQSTHSPQVSELCLFCLHVKMTKGMT